MQSLTQELLEFSFLAFLEVQTKLNNCIKHTHGREHSAVEHTVVNYTQNKKVRVKHHRASGNCTWNMKSLKLQFNTLLLHMHIPYCPEKPWCCVGNFYHNFVLRIKIQLETRTDNYLLLASSKNFLHPRYLCFTLVQLNVPKFKVFQAKVFNIVPKPVQLLFNSVNFYMERRNPPMALI